MLLNLLIRWFWPATTLLILGFWAAVVFIPHWNLHRLIYVVVCIFIVVVYAAGSEIIEQRKYKGRD